MNVDCNLFMQLLIRGALLAAPCGKTPVAFLQWLSKIGRKVWADKVNLLGRLPCAACRLQLVSCVSCVCPLFWWRIFHATCEYRWHWVAESKGAFDQRLSCIISHRSGSHIEVELLPIVHRLHTPWLVMCVACDCADRCPDPFLATSQGIGTMENCIRWRGPGQGY